MANTKVTGDLIASSTIATGNIADNAVTSDKISGITTAHITEGSNLYYTDARADARITAASTSDLSEGTNLYYTDARADARAALIVDSAPATLDTLNELAAALGDDPNFATTTATSIGLKAPLASPSFTGNAAFAGQVSAGSKFGLPDGGDLFWDGGYSSNKPVLAANGTTMKMYPSGASGGLQFSLSPTQATFAGTVSGTRFILPSTGTTTPVTQYLYTDNTNTGTGKLVIQSGGGSAGYGGGINLFSHSNATKPGWVTAGISASSGGKFSVNTFGNATGTDVFTVDASGNATFAGTATGTIARFDTLNNNANSANIIYRSGTDTIVGGGSPPNKIYVQDGGNVGIGTASPVSTWLNTFDPSTGNSTFKLTSEGWIVTPYLTGLAAYYPGQGARPIVWADTAGTNIQSWDNDASDGVRIRSSNNSVRLFVREDGNVGIGTTLPGSKLEIGVTQSDTMTPAAAAFAIKGYGGDGLVIGQRSSSPYAAWIQAGYLPTMGTSNHYPIALQPHGGSVGIGTDSPVTKLHVSDANAVVTIEATTNGQNCSTWYKANGNNQWETGCNISAGTDYQIYDRLNSASRMVVGHNGDVTIPGDVVIGTTGWGGVGKLVVNHSANINGGIVDTHANGGSRYYTRVAKIDTGSNSAGYWHVKTNVIISSNIMFLAKFYGYIYGQGAIMDLQHSGYAYQGGSVIAQGTINNSSIGGMSSAIYLTAANQVCFRIDLGGSTYYAGLWMDMSFQNPTGGNHQLEILGSVFSTATNYYT